jgi:DNA excision repair protein ERCC-2
MTRAKYRISVKSLVERVEQTGDIHFRFSSRSSAMEGIRGHQKLQKSRGSDYLAEQSVTDLVSFEDFDLEVTGRADGCIPGTSELLVEEIKTLRVDVKRLPEPVKRVHWAQARVYGYLLAREHLAREHLAQEHLAQEQLTQGQAVSQVTLRLTYYHLDENAEYCFDDAWSFAELEVEYQRLVNAYAEFLHQLLSWRAIRDESIKNLEMPYGEFRQGQRQMAVTVYRALQAEQQLVMQAPTGIGKTLGSLFPAVKSLQDAAYEKLFYLSAKTSGQTMAVDAIHDMRGKGLKIRDVTLTSKEKICFNPGTPCDPDYCQFAKGYYDKRPAVLKQAMASPGHFDRENIESLAREHEVCPFELSLDLTDISDVVVGDYNYVFDPTVYLRRHFDEPGKHALLMDEAHNLVDRGRDMFSATLSKDTVLAVRRSLGVEQASLKKSLAAVNRQMLAICGSIESTAKVSQFPDSLFRSLKKFIEAAESWLEGQSGMIEPELLKLYFDVLRFSRVAEDLNEDYACLVEKSSGETILKLFCVNPAKGLSNGFERVSASVCFSATMAPQAYFKSLMGLGENSFWYQIPSPFDANNLGVFTTSFLSTTYNNRASSLYDLVDTLAMISAAKPGNYLVFFPSHAYLKMVFDKFRERYPEREVLAQSSAMSDEARVAFLERFENVDVTVLGFAVMGGIFGEGVDLKGRRLIGSIVVGVGLPQIGTERNTIRDYFDVDGRGFEFAYQFPGMNRVLQTAGRVIRSEVDKGIVCLIDHRFNESGYRALFPPQWQVQQARHKQHLEQLLANFWSTEALNER